MLFVSKTALCYCHVITWARSVLHDECIRLNACRWRGEGVADGLLLCCQWFRQNRQAICLHVVMSQCFKTVITFLTGWQMTRIVAYIWPCCRVCPHKNTHADVVTESGLCWPLTPGCHTAIDSLLVPDLIMRASSHPRLVSAAHHRCHRHSSLCCEDDIYTCDKQVTFTVIRCTKQISHILSVASSHKWLAFFNIDIWAGFGHSLSVWPCIYLAFCEDILAVVWGIGYTYKWVLCNFYLWGFCSAHICSSHTGCTRV